MPDLHDALTAAAAEHRWDDALAAARAAAATDGFLEADGFDPLFAAAAGALADDRTEVAAAILDAFPADALDLVADLAATVRAIAAGDLVLGLACLLRGGGMPPAPHRRIAEELARRLDRGDWDARMLGVEAMWLADRDQDLAAPWAGARNLHHHPDVLALLVTRALIAREGAVFDRGAASAGRRLFAIARPLFDAAAARARRIVEGGRWAGVFGTYATALVLDDREEEARARIPMVVGDHPRRTKWLADDIDRAHADVAAWRARVLEAAAPHGTLASLGTFTIASPIATAGDPGYTGEMLARFHQPIVGVRPGAWQASVREDVVLCAHHVDHPCAPDDAIWLAAGSIDIEYGHAGLFDAADLTAGCRTGWHEGNGTADVWIARDADAAAIGVCIVFRA